MKIALRLDPKDNVATVTDSVKKGERVTVISEEGREIDSLQATEEIPLPFHKLAIFEILNKVEVRKYGEVIGVASKDIAKGEWVHVHNVESASMPGGVGYEVRKSGF